MLPALVVGGGIVYLLLREATKPKVDPEPEPEPTPEPTPEPEGMGTVYAVWSGEATVDNQVVWSYQEMYRAPDGSETPNRSEVFVIGNANHTSFLRANSDRGTIDIPKDLTGGDVDMENVVVFSSIEAALADLEEEDDPNDPVQPQPEPEDEDSGGSGGGFGGLPARPDYGLGGGAGSLFQNGGL